MLCDRRIYFLVMLLVGLLPRPVGFSFDILPRARMDAGRAVDGIVTGVV